MIYDGTGAKNRQESPEERLFIPAKPQISFSDPERRFRVCAYCRVSTDREEQLSSFELQQEHYRQLVLERPNWELRKVYADEGISGTSLKNRAEFNAMIEACEKGEYDLILTKSVSRFARNLVDCISLIRRLKNLDPPVGVFFETDNLNTISKDSELALTFLATLAQEESVKKREAMIWSLAQRFKDCKLLTPPLLGYDRPRDAAGNYIKYAPLQVNESEANIVRFIFDAYLYGWSQERIAGFLSDIGCRTKTGSAQWNSGSVGYVLQNERYCGDILTWKTFTADLFNHKRKKNRGNMDQYYYTGRHEAIISREKFEAAQALLQNRKHHVHGALPSLHVITGGVFHGFVPINHHWVNDDPGPYYDSSNSAGGKEKKLRVAKSAFSAFDLAGYQVVRSQFTQARYEGPAVTVSRERISFNLFCMRRFAEIGHVQLLLHPSQRKIAIRPCGEGSIHSIRWRPHREKPLYAKTLCCRYFCAALFRMMEWDPDRLYRTRGAWMKRDGEQIIIFDLENTVSLVPLPQADGLTARKRHAEWFPESWEGSFGEEFYDHIFENSLFYMERETPWQSTSPSIPAPGLEQFTAPSGQELKGRIEMLGRKEGTSYDSTGTAG